MTLLFKCQDLAPVLDEASATGTDLMLVKDQGVYFFAKGGAFVDGTREHIAYAVGCNPGVGEFDDWWNRGRDELGGDDFGETLAADSEVFDLIRLGAHDLEIEAIDDFIELRAVPAR